MSFEKLAFLVPCEFAGNIEPFRDTRTRPDNFSQTHVRLPCCSVTKIEFFLGGCIAHERIALATAREIGPFQVLPAVRVVAVLENCRSYPILGASIPCNGIAVDVVLQRLDAGAGVFAGAVVQHGEYDWGSHVFMVARLANRTGKKGIHMTCPPPVWSCA